MVKILLSSFLVGCTFADWAQIKTDFAAAQQNSTFRTLTQVDMDKVSEYGCWCYFEDHHGKGRGKPNDAIDSQCKILHDGYECAIMDGQLENYECEPWTVSYASATGLGFGHKEMSHIQDECIGNNPGDDKCAQRACMVEGWFVVEMLSLFVGGESVDESMRHANGFDRIDDCPINSDPTLKSDKACCGIYPIRYPFKVFEGERACCGSSTYNANVLTCCDDGKAKMNC